MKLTVIDLELTQPANKIIEIGAVTLDITKKNFFIINHFNMLCHPGDLPSDFIAELTGITADQVSSSLPIKDVLQMFWDHEPIKNMAGWGSDTYQIIQASMNYKIKFDTPNQFNFKQIINFIQYVNKKNRYKASLKSALDAEGIVFEGVPHNAYDDAYNTAKLIWHTFQKGQKK